MQEVPSDITRFCGACHAVPSPASFPKDAWYDEVRRGFQFYYDSGRSDLTVPVQSAVAAWYRSQAPVEFVSLPDDSTPSPVSFQQDVICATDRVVTKPVGISFVDILSDSEGRAAADHTYCVSDMHNGGIQLFRIDATGTSHVIQSIGADAIPNPATVRSLDLNGNGARDMVVADLGSPLPADHDRGRVVWFSDTDDLPQPLVLLDNVGRVADVRPADFDGDGDTDLVVAEFGWHKTGGIHVLWNESLADTAPIFRRARLDSRAGPIHVPVVDLDRDGRLDFVALISQEHEVIEAFLNRPNGFENQRLFAAPDPSYGSSGIELTDFDGDGDVDILYTNGDTFDSNLIKPYHGIQLLINRGDLMFDSRTVGTLPGVHRALPSDVDGDGDLDVVASALLPAAALTGLKVDAQQAVVWFEQTEAGAFLRHVVQSGRPNHATLLVRDLDGDGSSDIITGCFQDIADPSLPVLEVFRNDRLRSPE